MKQKYNITRWHNHLYYETEDKSHMAIIEDLEEQLILDMENGIDVEILGEELHPVHIIETNEDLFNALFKNATDNSKNNPVVLTPHLCQFISKGDGRSFYKNGKEYFYNVTMVRGVKEGLPVTKENMENIKRIVNKANEN